MRVGRILKRNLVSASMVAAATMAAVALAPARGGRAIANTIEASPQSDLPCPANPPSRITIPKPEEPGMPLLVEGVVFEADKKTPIPGAILYVYHTDARGFYASPGSHVSPRLFGCIKTDRHGEYAFQTIEPGHYPGGGVPRHIHVKIWAPGYREYVGELQFAGDPELTPEDIANNTKDGSFSDIQPLQSRAGVLLCRRDFALQR